MEKVFSKESVLEANITFHTSLSNTYNEQPHFSSENRNRIAGVIKDLINHRGTNTCIDLGCGTGFMIDLTLPFFNRVYGIDITPAMMSQVDLSSGKVQLIEANTEAVPLKDETANMITSNSFLHHLWDIKPTILEAFRLLKPGGVFFSEEDPNFLYWQALKNLAKGKVTDLTSDYLLGEINSVMKTHSTLGEKINIAPETVKMAEYQKMVKGGMNSDEVNHIFQQAGFSEVNVQYYWFLGQGKVAQRSQTETEQVEAYLKSILPISNNLFKYLRVVAWK